MPLKFKRNYRLLLNTINQTLDTFKHYDVPAGFSIQNKSIQINPPFTIDLDVTRTKEAMVNTALITVYNLNEQTRTLIRKDGFDFEYRPIELWAGYSDGVPSPEELLAGPNANTQSQQIFPRIFRGNITRAYSYRQGPNFITKFECLDGGVNYAGKSFEASYDAGTPYSEIIEDMINAMPFCRIGAIDDFPGVLVKGETFSGSAEDELGKLLTQFGGYFFKDGERVSALLPGNFVSYGEERVLSNANGIIGVPIKAANYVEVEMLFEPNVTVGQRIKLVTSKAKYYNGSYFVCGISHKGTISPTVCGTLTTKLTLNALANGALGVLPWSKAS